MSLITPFVIKRLRYYGSICSNSLLSLLITKYASKKQKLEPKQEKEETVPKDFDSIYSAYMRGWKRVAISILLI